MPEDVYASGKPNLKPEPYSSKLDLKASSSKYESGKSYGNAIIYKYPPVIYQIVKRKKFGMEIDSDHVMYEKNEIVDNLNTDIIVRDDIEEPQVGKIFDTMDDMMNFYIKYGNSIGFPISTRSSRKGDDGQVRWINYVCARSRQPLSTSKNAFRMHPVSRTNCKAMLRGALCPNGKWRVTLVILDHNHDLSPHKSRYYKHNRIMKPYVKRKLEINDRAGIMPNKNFNSMVIEAGGHDHVPFIEKDCYNYLSKIRQLRLGDGDAAAIQTYFLKMQANSSDFFYTMDLDNDGRLKNVFWADARSRSAYQEFGDVVSFDTKFKEFQDELTGKIYCEITSWDDSLGIYTIFEDLNGDSNRSCIFKVQFKTNESKIECSCRLFEFRGILCKHAITALIHNKIKAIPEEYIIRRWRKDIKRYHTKVKIYSDWFMNPENERFDRLCSMFHQAADLATTCEKKTEQVMDWINELIQRLKT